MSTMGKGYKTRTFFPGTNSSKLSNGLWRQNIGLMMSLRFRFDEDQAVSKKHGTIGGKKQASIVLRMPSEL